MKAAVPAESYVIYLFIFLHHLESPAMSTGSSQLGAALSPSFYTFLSLYLSRFSFYINIVLTCVLKLNTKVTFFTIKGQHYNWRFFLNFV